MSKKRSTKKTNQSETQKAANARRKFISRSVTVVGGLAVAGVSYAAFQLRHKRIYDLEVIGNGTPTVVQVHDPGCPKCRKLKARVDAVKHDYKNVQFRIANLSSTEGARLARKYGVGKVTLLVFDGEGEMIEMLQGVYPEDQLRREFNSL